MFLPALSFWTLFSAWCLALLFGLGRDKPSLSNTLAANGDSITFGFSLTDPSGRWPLPWPLQLYQLLRTFGAWRFGHSQRPLDSGGFWNLGANGKTLGKDAINKVLVSETAQFRPIATVIAAGINDVALNATLVEMQGYATGIATGLLATGTVPIFTTLLTYPGLTGPQQAIRTAYNAWLLGGGLPAGSLVSDPAANAHLQDNANPLYYQADQLHPTELGLGIFASIVLPTAQAACARAL